MHVLGPPQTFALSQDQTLQFELISSCCSILFSWVCLARALRSRRRARRRADEVASRYRSRNPARVFEALARRSCDPARASRPSPVPLSSFQGALGSRGEVPGGDRTSSPGARLRQGKPRSPDAGFRTSRVIAPRRGATRRRRAFFGAVRPFVEDGAGVGDRERLPGGNSVQGRRRSRCPGARLRGPSSEGDGRVHAVRRPVKGYPKIAPTARPRCGIRGAAGA